jgi:hypothetical protein
VAWWVIFLNSSKLGFGGAPLEQFYQFGESRDRFTLLVDQIHDGVDGARSVWQIKMDLNLILVTLERVNLYPTGFISARPGYTPPPTS